VSVYVVRDQLEVFYIFFTESTCIEFLYAAIPIKPNRINIDIMIFPVHEKLSTDFICALVNVIFCILSILTNSMEQSYLSTYLLTSECIL
jgi:hypothetical protein